MKEPVLDLAWLALVLSSTAACVIDRVQLAPGDARDVADATVDAAVAGDAAEDVGLDTRADLDALDAFSGDGSFEDGFSGDGSFEDAFSGDAFSGDGSFEDVFSGDAPRPWDAPCALREVQCDGTDDDCDGRIDEDFDLVSDRDNCGRCGNACSFGQVCAGGACSAPSFPVAVGAGENFSCVLVADGRVFCWGSDANGRLGNGMSGGDSRTAVAVDGIDDARALSVGRAHACVVRRSGRVACWGANRRRQLGAGGMTDQESPIDGAGGLMDAVTVAAGGEHTCALRSTGAVSCWGRDNDGQLGDGAMGMDRSEGMDVVGFPALSFATVVAAGASHSCATLASSNVYCWGGNAAGQLGDGTTMRSPRPVLAMGISARTVAAGGDFTCAVSALSGNLHCWGGNGSGQLGDGTTTSRSTPGGALPGVTSALEVTAGTAHACARSLTATWCWGNNGSGRLGDGTTMNRTRPTVVPELAARSIAAGNDHSCAIRNDGVVVCWGENGSGQLGDGTTTDSSRPVVVTGLP